MNIKTIPIRANSLEDAIQKMTAAYNKQHDCGDDCCNEDEKKVIRTIPMSENLKKIAKNFSKEYEKLKNRSEELQKEMDGLNKQASRLHKELWAHVTVETGETSDSIRINKKTEAIEVTE